ncbi:MAG TPA: putative baseplate assembly protein [Chloroflexota bacterium]
MYCPDETRKALVRADGSLNGIDYVEVLDQAAPSGTPRQQTLLLRCLRPVDGLGQGNLRVEGGVRITNINVEWAFAADSPDLAVQLDPDEGELLALVGQLDDPDRLLVVRTDRPGDFSTYVLRLSRSSLVDEAPPGFDPLLAATPFAFKIECPSDFDCDTVQAGPAPGPPEPVIDYLAKDYASFRQLMLDRLAVVMPDWQERNLADIGVALVEVLAYAADHLSYFQDAVATEAYLDTARRRISVRRHARLVDYFVHDGANARAWVCFTVTPHSDADGATLPSGTRLLSRESQAEPIVFETLHDVRLHASGNAIPFYTWGDPNCLLPVGATRATLRGGGELGLGSGDTLVFEEVLGTESGRDVDADPRRRHVVRLNAQPVVRVDPLTDTTVLDISWYVRDALPMQLSLREFSSGGASVARANVALADHGRTFADEQLDPARVPSSGRYRPVLRQVGLTQRSPYRHDQARLASAAEATTQDTRTVGPDIILVGDGETWLSRRDLLASDRFAPEFVVEMEEDGRAHLRFGDDVLGRAPAAGASFSATYRIGNGSAGNVGGGSIARVVSHLAGIIAVTNPLAATGGTDPEPLDQIRLYAPQAFRTQERAITALDYGIATQRHPEVQRAAATRRWTGSWYTMYVTVDRLLGRPVDAAFESAMRAHLERFRLAGHDLEIDAPRFVPLDIALTVCVAPGFYRSIVKQALLERFSSVDLPSGQRGFFHPDNFTFGQPVFLSQIVAAAMATPGVYWVDADDTAPKANRFQRWGQPARGEVAAGRIAMGRLEIARLDNDLNRAENGRIDFLMQGGL